MPGIVPLGHEAAEPADPGAMIGLDAEHVVEEPRARAAKLQDRAAQLVGQAALTVHAPKVEQNVAEPERRFAPPADPAGHLLAPLYAGLAPDRVDRHDPAAAERKAELIELGGHPIGELNEEGIDAGVLAVRVIVEDEAVVLVREQVALAAPARAHDDRREGDRRCAPAGRPHGIEIEREHAPVDVVVDRRDQALDLGRGHAVGEEIGGELDLGRLDLAQPLERGLVGQTLDVLDQARVGDGERLVQVEHAGERAPGIDHRHVAKMQAAHHADRLVERLLGPDRGDRAGHQGGDRLIADRAPGDPAGHVLLGQDAGNPLPIVQDDRGRGAGLAHPGDHLERRQIGRHHHGRRLHVIADATPKRCGLGMLASHRSAQLLEQRLGVLEVGGVEALGEPVVDRREEVVGLVHVALIAPQAGEAGRSAQLQDFASWLRAVSIARWNHAAASVASPVSARTMPLSRDSSA